MKKKVAVRATRRESLFLTKGRVGSRPGIHPIEDIASFHEVLGAVLGPVPRPGRGRVPRALLGVYCPESHVVAGVAPATAEGWHVVVNSNQVIDLLTYTGKTLEARCKCQRVWAVFVDDLRQASRAGAREVRLTRVDTLD